MYKLGKMIMSKDDFEWHQNIKFNNYIEVEDFLSSEDCDKNLIGEFHINIGNKILYVTKDINDFLELTRRSLFNVYKGLYSNVYDDNRLKNKEYYIFSITLK